jgi:hypothetical protein
MPDEVFMRPADDSYDAFEAFMNGMVSALKPGAAVEIPEEKMRRAYEAYLAARKKSGGELHTGDEPEH